MESIIQFFKDKGPGVDYVLDVNIVQNAQGRGSAFVAYFTVSATVIHIYETDDGTTGIKVAKKNGSGGWYSSSYRSDAKITWDIAAAMNECPFVKFTTNLTASSSTNTAPAMSGSIGIEMDRSRGGKFYSTSLSSNQESTDYYGELTDDTITRSVASSGSGSAKGIHYIYVHVKE